MKKIVTAAMIALALGACSKTQIKEEAKAPVTTTASIAVGEPTPAPTAAPTVAPTPAVELGALQVKDVVLGSGAEAVAGHRVTVHYTGRLLTGKKFDSSLDRGTPFQFALGAGQVIKGWDQGVAGMKVGGKRQLVIPPHLAYGPEGRPPVIPPSATLVFDVELLGVD